MDIYSSLEQPNHISQISTVTQIDITEDKWQRIVKDVFCLTNCTKLRWFQYRLINHILTTNYVRVK